MSAEPFCTVSGQRVTEFRALINGAAATLITDTGTFVASRVYFVTRGPKGTPFEGKPCFDLGDGAGRVGSTGQRVLSCDYDPDKGLRLHLTDYDVQVPPGSLSVSWKRPG